MKSVYSRVTQGFSRSAGRVAVFLDRDGVVIEDTDYLCRVEDMRYIEGAADAISALNRAGFAVALVTNQAGIGRGYYTWADFEAVQAALEARLAESGAWLDGVWACPFHKDGIEEFRAENHSHRKPNPGMLADAAADMGLDLPKSWMVGDKICDVEAGLNAGVAAVAHVETGYGRKMRSEVKARFEADGRIRLCADLRDAVSLILNDRK